MEIQEAFVMATKNKLRYTTHVGTLTVEDLWDLPLSADREGTLNLDDIAIGLNKVIKQESDTESFVKNLRKPKTLKETEAKFVIVLYVIDVKQEAAERLQASLDAAAKKQRILEIIESKKDSELASKTTEELEELLKNL